MSRSTKYVALDVHQATTVSSVREERGRVIDQSVLPTTAAAITEFFRRMRGAIHVVFEEGTQAQWLYDLLMPLVDRVVVCNRRGQATQGNKGIISMRMRCPSCCVSAGMRCSRCTTVGGSAAR
jgi:hypothetical protein